MIALFVFLALASPEKRPGDALQVAETERLAADIICGEAGADEAVGMLVAHVIDNRMSDLAGRRADKLRTVLTVPHQFNGRCKIPMPNWAPYLARQLVTGGIRTVWRPRWLKQDVKWFTERKSAERWLKWKHKPRWLRGLRKVKTFNGMVFFGKA